MRRRRRQALPALLVDCWEGAALRSRIRGNPAPLTAMLDFYFRAALQ
jgi:TetR/AcrR family transcriptional repressor of nem operon